MPVQQDLGLLQRLAYLQAGGKDTGQSTLDKINAISGTVEKGLSDYLTIKKFKDERDKAELERQKLIQENTPLVNVAGGDFPEQTAQRTAQTFKQPLSVQDLTQGKLVSGVNPATKKPYDTYMNPATGESSNEPTSAIGGNAMLDGQYMPSPIVKNVPIRQIPSIEQGVDEATKRAEIAKPLMDEFGKANVEQAQKLAHTKAILPKTQKLISDEQLGGYYNLKTKQFSVEKPVNDPSIPLSNADMQKYALQQGKPTNSINSVTWETATPEQRRLAEQMVKGNVIPTDLGFRDRGAVVVLANEYAFKNGLPFRSYEGNIKKGTAQDFAYGKTAQKSDSLNLALSHSDAAKESFKALDSFDNRLINIPINKFKAYTDDDKVLSLGADLVALRGELANVFKATGATDQEIAAWHDVLNDSLTPNQAVNVINEVQKLLAGRLQGIEYRQENVMKGGSFNRDILTPQSKEIMANNPKIKKPISKENKKDQYGYSIGETKVAPNKITYKYIGTNRWLPK